MSRITRFYGVCFFTLLSLASFSAHAAICRVGSAEAYTTIQSAIDDTSCNRIDVQPGTYFENISIARDIVIAGVSPASTIIDGSEADRVVTIETESESSWRIQLSNLTIQNGSTRYDGGGLHTGLNNNVVLTRVNFLNNYAADDGGAIFTGIEFVGSLTVTDSVILNNEAHDGAGIYNMGTLALNKVTIANNRASVYGGGVFNENTLVSQNSQIRGNTAGSYGGGEYSAPRSDSESVMVNTIVAGNSADRGAGISLSIASGGRMTIQTSTIQDNEASERGGGLYVENSADDATAVTIQASAILQNQAPAGGGIYTYAGITVENSTLAGNVASETGGAYWDRGDHEETTTFNNVTVYQNTSSEGGGGLYLYQTIDLGNSILGENSGGDCDGLTGPTLFGNNLISDDTCGDTYTPTDADLGALGSHGGATQTYVPMTGSPAIDGGDDATCETRDQRGVGRPQGDHCDIGAVEVTSLD